MARPPVRTSGRHVAVAATCGVVLALACACGVAAVQGGSAATTASPRRMLREEANSTDCACPSHLQPPADMSTVRKFAWFSAASLTGALCVAIAFKTLVAWRAVQGTTTSPAFATGGKLRVALLLLLLGVRSASTIRAGLSLSHCVSGADGFSGMWGAMLSNAGFILSSTYAIAVIRASRDHAQLAGMRAVYALAATSAVASTVGVVLATLNNGEGSSYSRLALAACLVCMACAVAVCASLPSGSHRGIRTVAALATFGTAARLGLDALELLLFTPLQAACDSAGLSPFLGTGMFFSLEIAFIAIPAVWAFRAVSGIKRAADSVQPKRFTPAAAQSAVTLAVWCWLGLVVIGLIAFNIAGTLELHYTQPSTVRTDFLSVGSNWVLAGFAMARVGASLCTVCIILLTGLVHRYLSHVVFGSILGVHYVTNHKRVRAHLLLSLALVASITMHVVGHVIAEASVQEGKRCARPSVYHSMGALFESYPSVTGMLMIASALGTGVVGLGLTRSRGGCGQSWDHRHTIHLVGALAFVAVFPLHGAEKRFCKPPLNGYVLVAVELVYGCLYLAGRWAMPVAAVKVCDTTLFLQRPAKDVKDYVPPSFCSRAMMVCASDRTVKEAQKARLPYQHTAVLRVCFECPRGWRVHDNELAAPFVLVSIDHTHAHPFTLANAFGRDDEGGGVVTGELHIQLNGSDIHCKSWTWRLLDHLGTPPEPRGVLRVRGPFRGPISCALAALLRQGTDQVPGREPRHVSLFLLSRGVGCTAMLAALHFLLRNGYDCRVDRVHWACYVSTRTGYHKFIKAEAATLQRQWRERNADCPLVVHVSHQPAPTLRRDQTWPRKFASAENGHLSPYRPPHQAVDGPVDELGEEKRARPDGSGVTASAVAARGAGPGAVALAAEPAYCKFLAEWAALRGSKRQLLYCGPSNAYTAIRDHADKRNAQQYPNAEEAV